jgi:hypothetical protein
MQCKYCQEYDVESYDQCIPGELCPNCREYTIPDCSKQEYTTDFHLLKQGHRYYLGTLEKRYTEYFENYASAEAAYDYAKILGKLAYFPVDIPEDIEIPF